MSEVTDAAGVLISRSTMANLIKCGSGPIWRRLPCWLFLALGDILEPRTALGACHPAGRLLAAETWESMFPRIVACRRSPRCHHRSCAASGSAQITFRPVRWRRSLQSVSAVFIMRTWWMAGWKELGKFHLRSRKILFSSLLKHYWNHVSWIMKHLLSIKNNWMLSEIYGDMSMKSKLGICIDENSSQVDRWRKSPLSYGITMPAPKWRSWATLATQKVKWDIHKDPPGEVPVSMSIAKATGRKVLISKRCRKNEGNLHQQHFLWHQCQWLLTLCRSMPAHPIPLSGHSDGRHSLIWLSFSLWLLPNFL